MLFDELEKGNDDILVAMLAETFGISTTATTMMGSGKKWDALKEEKGDEIYNESLKKVTENFNRRADALEKSPRWKKMTNKEQNDALSDIRTEETEKIFARYNID
jgi:hypothetical protein